MNTTVWLISFTDRGEKVQKAHTHNCVADYRLIDPDAIAQEIDCAAVAELIEALVRISQLNTASLAAKSVAGTTAVAIARAALANVGGAK